MLTVPVLEFYTLLPTRSQNSQVQSGIMTVSPEFRMPPPLLIPPSPRLCRPRYDCGPSHVLFGRRYGEIQTVLEAWTSVTRSGPLPDSVDVRA